jgi:hypothetical protein
MRAGRAALAFLCLPAALWAADRTWTGAVSTNWATAGNWTGGVPGAGDRAIIPPTANAPVISATPGTINQLLVQAGATLTINTGQRLNIDGGTSPFIDGTGTVVTPGTGEIRITGGVNNGTVINQSMTLGTLTLQAGGNTSIIASGTTVVFNGNLNVNDARLRLGVPSGAGVTLDINGNINIPGQGFLEVRTTNVVLRVSGNWTQTGQWQSGNGSTVIFDGTVAQFIDIDRRQVAQFDFENFRVSNTSALVTYLNNSPASTPNGFNVLDNLTIDAGARFEVQDFAVIGNAAGDVFGIGSGATVRFASGFDPDCTVSFDVDGGADDGTLILSGTNYPTNDGSDFGIALIPGNGTVRLEYTSSGTLNLVDGGPFAFHNLVVDTNNGGGQIGKDVVSIVGALNVLNDLTLIEGQFSLPAGTHTVGRHIDSSAADDSQLDFYQAGTLNVAGNVDLDSFSQAVSGFSTLRMTGTAPQTFQVRATTASDFYDLDHFRISNPAGVTVLDNPNANFRTNGTLTLDPGAVLTVRDQFDPDGPLVFSAGGGNNLRLENIVTADGSFLGTAFTPGTGTVTYAAPFNQTVYTRFNGGATIPYYNVAVDTTGAAVAVQEAAGVLDVNGSFTIVDADAEFTAGPGGMVVSGSFVANGTFNALAHTVTMDGTGSISGTFPTLDFNNLVVNGAGALVTAARDFRVLNAFGVDQGTLTTSGSITMTALNGVTAGNGSGGAGTLELAGPATLAIQPGRSLSVNGVDGVFRTRISGGTPTLTSAAPPGSFDTQISGTVDVNGLNFRFGDANGLELLPGATFVALRNVRFTDLNPAAGASPLTIRSAGGEFDCPGCWFDPLPAGTFNVRAFDTAAGGTQVRVRLENRGIAPAAGGGGPGAGEAGDGDDDTNGDGVLDGLDAAPVFGGSIVHWLYTVNVDVLGTLQGFPMPAFDWSTFSTYAVYALARNSAGTSDSIYVMDTEGDLRYSYTLPGEDILGPVFWDQEAGVRVVYFGTASGRVYKLIDSGAGLAPPSSGPWATPFIDSSNPPTQRLAEVTSALISDQTNVYFGGLNSSFNGIYKIQISDKTMPHRPISTSTRRIATAPSWSDASTGRSLFLASNAVAGASNIYRVHVPSWVIDATYSRTSGPPADDCTTDFEAFTNLAFDTLLVGETNGYMHGIAGLGPPATFLEIPGYPFRDSTSPVRGGAVKDFFLDRVFYGNDNGSVYTLGAWTGAWSLGVNYWRLDAGVGAVRTMPLYDFNGVLYAATAAGRLLIIDVNNGAGQTLLQTYHLGVLPLGDVSRDPSTLRIYVGSQAGRLYAVDPVLDPTAPK